MTSARKIRDWLRKHRSIFRKRPSNGERALDQIEPIIQELRENNSRVRDAVNHICEETAAGKRIMANDHIINNNRS